MLSVGPASHATASAFYRAHREPARIGSHEQIFGLLGDDDDSIHGAVRLVPKQDGKLGRLNFLRALHVSPRMRRQGWGSKLCQAALEATEPEPCYCFAYDSLVKMYSTVGFAPSDAARVPRWLADDFEKVSRQQARKARGLVLMTHGFARTPLRLILLQHAKEDGRPSATAPLLHDPRLRGHLCVERWVWSGRNDAEKMAAAIAALPTPPQLLWTDGPTQSRATLQTDGEAPSELAVAADERHGERTSASSQRDGRIGRRASDAVSYVIIDGTWQEARQIYRKTPALHRLPRVALRGMKPSSYVLRGDYGWRARFGGAAGSCGSESSSLLCTAEAAAGLLENAGDAVGGETVLQLLDEFQREYASRHPHLQQLLG